MRKAHALGVATVAMLVVTIGWLSTLIWFGSLVIDKADNVTGWMCTIVFSGIVTVIPLSVTTGIVGVEFIEELPK